MQLAESTCMRQPTRARLIRLLSSLPLVLTPAALAGGPTALDRDEAPAAAPARSLKLADSPWPMFRHDLKHTGRTPYTGPATPTLAWTFAATDGIVSSPAIGTDGTIYVGAGWYYAGAADNRLYALNTDGSLKWEFTGGNGFFSSPALAADNVIYITSLDGSIYAVRDMGTYAQLLWNTSLDYFFALSSPAIGADGTVYVGSPDFYFYSLNPADGAVNWRWRSKWCIISSPAIGDGELIYVGSKDHHVYAFDDALEAPVWGFATGRFYDGHLVDSSPAIGADGTIYVGSDQYGAWGQTPIPVDTSFWAINPDGTLRWSFETGDGVESSPAIGPDGTVYFGSYDTYLYAVADEGSEGVLKWKFPTNGAIDGSPTVDADGVVYFGSRDGNIYALRPDGTLKWTYPTGDGIEGSPAIDDRGYLYIGSLDGNLYALGTGAPDVGVADVRVPSHVMIDMPYIPRATVRNFRGTEQACNVTCAIEREGAVVYTDTATVSIPGGGSRYVAFAPWQVGEVLGEHYLMTVSTQLPEDDNVDNDPRVVEIISDLGPEFIPTLSGWAVIIMVGLILTAGTLVVLKGRPRWRGIIGRDGR